jgi:hypothetical protein
MALTYDGGEGCHWDEDQVNTDTVNGRLIEVIVSILLGWGLYTSAAATVNGCY